VGDRQEVDTYEALSLEVGKATRPHCHWSSLQSAGGGSIACLLMGKVWERISVSQWEGRDSSLCKNTLE
jgi:hypothetical protein